MARTRYIGRNGKPLGAAAKLATVAKHNAVVVYRKPEPSPGTPWRGYLIHDSGAPSRGKRVYHLGHNGERFADSACARDMAERRPELLAWLADVIAVDHMLAIG